MKSSMTSIRVIYVHREREKVNFKSREVNCLKECALALNEVMPECIPCDRPLTIKHVLIECIDTAEIRKQYFNCTDLKTLFNSVAGDTILAFLADVHLVDKI